MNIDFARCEFGQEERDAVNRVLSGHWLASGLENEAFEKEFAQYIGTDFAVVLNSGSSANLLALASLKLSKGSKVLTSACGFPATLSPILHLGLEPVLVDYNLETHNIDVDQVIAKMKSEEGIKAILFAHTLGNPVDLKSLVEVANNLGISIIEDCCEAVGSKIGERLVGSFGTLGTYSFYSSHQITALGMGGMVVTANKYLAREIRSMRDWGKRWDWDDRLGDHKTVYTASIDGIPYYPHYCYQTVGWNMKLGEANAAFGRENLKRLDHFTQRRVENYEYLRIKLSKFDDTFIPVKAIPEAKPSWFAYPLTLREGGFDLRRNFGDWLESKGIRTRPFFAGNITKHPPFLEYREDFLVADKLMRDSLFFGVWQGLGKIELDYIAEQVETWVSHALGRAALSKRRPRVRRRVDKASRGVIT